MKDALDPRPSGVPSGRVAALTMAALLSFALNSLLCRGALGAGLIDAPTFTLVRLVAGALVLGLLSRRSPAPVTGSLPHRVDRVWSTLALFLYALPFSLAYVRIEAGTGAFIVFGCVQITMVGSDLLAGRGMRRRESLGLFVALIGLASLTRPGTGSPDLAGVLLMALSGCAWGVYSILGRRSGPPLAATARNFAATIPLRSVRLGPRSCNSPCRLSPRPSESRCSARR
jgi:drug/metabolite transporter (DMT)-like permease